MLEWKIDVMANTVSDIKPAVISSVGPVQAHPEGEMDALLLGRTRVSTKCIECENVFNGKMRYTLSGSSRR